MAERLPPSEKTSQAIGALLSQGSEHADVKSELVRLAVRKSLEEVLEAEVNDALARGYRNGAPDGYGGPRP